MERDLETTVTQKGQVTIPSTIRARLGLKPRDKVVFEIDGDRVTLRLTPSGVERGFGSVKPRKSPEDYPKIRAAFEKYVADDAIPEP